MSWGQPWYLFTDNHNWSQLALQGTPASQRRLLRHGKLLQKLTLAPVISKLNFHRDAPQKAKYTINYILSYSREIIYLARSH